jgi:hypothetical protein
MTDQTTDQTTISHADAMRIRNACFNMPYAADTRRVTIPIHPVTADKLVTFLEGLAEILRDAGAAHTALEATHGQLVRDVAAFRRIIGTADPS